MATNGVISIVKDGKVQFKCVAGCNGMEARKTADILRHLKNPTIEQVYKICLDNDFGCKFCTVVQSENEFRQRDMEDELPELYLQKFNTTDFNPRWAIGTADHMEVIYNS